MENRGCDEDTGEDYFYCGGCECEEKWYHPSCGDAQFSGCPVLLCDDDETSWCYVVGPLCGRFVKSGRLAKRCTPECDEAAWVDFASRHRLEGIAADFHEASRRVRMRLLRAASSQVNAADLGYHWTPMPRAAEANTYFSSNSEGLLTAYTGEQTLTSSLSNDFSRFPFDTQWLRCCVKLHAAAHPLVIPWSLDASFKPTSLAALADRTGRSFAASDASPHLGAMVIEALGDRGFRVMTVGSSSRLSDVCLDIEVARNYGLLVLRLLGPMVLLLCTSAAGALLPVHLAMPRVSIGFVSFLSLQVFTTRAYSMLPEAAHALTFIDVLMFSITEMLFIAVSESIVALCLDARLSLCAANHLDAMFRIWYPVMVASVLLVEISMAMWAVDVSQVVIAGVGQVIIFGIAGGVGLRAVFYIRRLPQNIIHGLIKDINSGKIEWSSQRLLQPQELSVIFKFMDKDMSGHISKEEFTQTFKDFGLKLTEAELTELNQVVTEKCGAWIDFPTFMSNFDEFFAGSHRLQRRSNRRLEDESDGLTNDQ